MNPTVEALAAAAKRREIETFIPNLSEGFIRFRKAERQLWVHKTRTPYLSSLSAKIVTDKFLSGDLLREAGLPVADKIICHELNEAAFAFMERCGEVVVKPQARDRGVGVTLRVGRRSGLLDAFQRARAEGPVLIEKYIAGREYRVLVIGGRVAGVLEWKPLGPVAENARPGGEIPVDRTSVIHPAFKELALRAAQIFEIDVAGIDLICPDIALAPSPDFSHTAVLEINPGPDFLAHLRPVEGQPQPVCDLFLDYLFK